MTDVSTPESLFSWIHLADLQIGRGGGAYGWERQLVLEGLRKDIAAWRSYGVPAPDAIFVTGDIAQSGAAEEYASARDWLLGVAGSVGLGPDRVFVVPGNHDVDRTADRDRDIRRLLSSLREGRDQLDDALSDPKDRARLAARLSHYLSFAEGFAPMCLGSRSDEEHGLFWAHRLDARSGLRVRLLGLDTALMSADDADMGKLRLGTEQIDRGLRNPSIEDGELVVVLSHHPLHSGWFADEKNTAPWIQNYAHIHLHGQVHEAGSEAVRSGGGRGLVRIAAGAWRSHDYSFAAVNASAGEPKVRIWSRAWSEKNKHFVVGVDNTPDGQSFAEHGLRVELGAKQEAPRGLLPTTALFEGPGAMPAVPVPSFLGRSAELDALRRALVQQSEAVCIVASGIGGIGKTTLARQFVATEAEQLFPEGAAWIDATTLPSELARVAQRFGWQGERLPTVEEANKWLAVALHDRPVLLVVDNVDPEQVDPCDLPVPGGRCRTLITSRSIALHEDLGKPAQALPLGKWSDATCREYLRRVTKRDDLHEDAELNGLAHFVGNLPLAIRLMAKLLKRGVLPERLLAQIKEQPLGTLDAVARGADRGVAQTFVTAFQALSENERRVLVTLSACAQTTRAEVVAKVADVSESVAEGALVELWERRSLVEYDAKLARPWGLHDVVRMFLRKQEGAEDATTRQYDFADTHLTDHAAPMDWEAAERELPEVMAAIEQAIRARNADHAKVLLAKAAELMGRRGHAAEVRRLFLELSSVLAPDSHDLAVAFCNIGVAERALGNLDKAVEYLERALKIHKKEDPNRSLGLVLNNLSAVYLYQGNLIAAANCAEKSCSVAGLLGDSQLGADGFSTWGICSYRLHDYVKAIVALKKARDLYAELDDVGSQAMMLVNVGICYGDLGESKKALEYLGRALELGEHVGFLEGQLIALRNIGVCFLSLGDQDKAVEWFERALVVAKQMKLTAGHPHVGDLGRCIRQAELAKLSSGTNAVVKQSVSMVYITKVVISNTKAIVSLDWTRTREDAPGWHVILGDNGSGKTTVLRSISLALIGSQDSSGLRMRWGSLMRIGAAEGTVEVTLVHPPGSVQLAMPSGVVMPADAITVFRVKMTGEGLVDSSADERRVWNDFSGNFSAAYGPFRRFSDGDTEYERLLSGQPRLARHISLFDSRVALTESLAWLRDLHHKKLEHKPEGKLLDPFTALANDPGPPFFLPHGMRLENISSSGITMKDGNGLDVPIEDLSDGYRAILSLAFDLIRHMANSFGYDRLFDPNDPTVILPGGIVLVDEIDAHLHPTWQRQIGLWFKKHFPNVQFIVTTHSPLVCQTADSIFFLPAPGSDDEPHMLEQEELYRIRYGNVLDAYGTGAFGRGVTRSEKSKEMRKRLAALNRKEVDVGLSPEEQEEQLKLRAVMPSAVSTLGSDSREGGA